MTQGGGGPNGGRCANGGPLGDGVALPLAPAPAGQDAAGNTSAPMRGMYLGRADITEK